MACINVHSEEFRSLQEKTGLSTFNLKVEATYFMDKYGRFPRIDEIPGVDTKKALFKEMGVSKDDDIVSSKDILINTNSKSSEEAQIKLNSKYLDKEVQITEMGDLSHVEVRNRPNKGISKNIEQVYITESSIPDNVYFADALDRLSSLYGLNYKQITNEELALPEWRQKVPDGQRSSAFIFNGDIYINTDNIKSSSPIHELMHIFFGSTKYSNPDLYNSLVNLAEQLPNYDKLSQRYPNRTRSDINEEILVSEFSKYVVGEESILNNLDKSVKNEIKYNISRTLDSMIFGKDSIEKLSIDQIMNSSIKELSYVLKSTKFNTAQAYVSRVLNNKKSKLMKEGKLKEICI